MSTAETALPTSLAEQAAACLREPGLQRLARHATANVVLHDGVQTHVLLVAPAADAARLTLVADTPVWAQALAARPAPGYQSIGAMRRAGVLTVQGPELAAAQMLPLLEMLLAALRRRLHGAAPQDAEDANDDLGALRGRYVRIATRDRPVSVYEDSAGDAGAPPLLMLHTAGADARQWHGLMSRADMRARWRMLAFDFPGHGRSQPHAEQLDWDWTLRADDYAATVIAYLDACDLSRVTLIGCSMGAAIGLALLARHPDRFDAAILLETPYYSPGRRSVYLDHPAVHGARLGAAWVGSLLSPDSPRARRQYATWIYSQAAPSVYDGDLAFYSDAFRASDYTGRIDTARTPLWLLTGDYDYSASPAETAKVAAEVPGAEFVRLEGFGHFPMTEDPARLATYLAPIAARLAASA